MATLGVDNGQQSANLAGRANAYTPSCPSALTENVTSTGEEDTASVASSAATVDSGIVGDYTASRGNVSSASSSRRRPRLPAPAKYKEYDERIKSFEGISWPKDFETTPEQLSKAGFYFYDKPDKVKCAYCYGTLKNWEKTDTAMGEHTKHYPDCPFVESIEQQTKVLSKNLRTQKNGANYMSSNDLIEENKQKKLQAKKSPPGEIFRKTFQKMGYTEAIIEKALNLLKRRREKVTVHSVMEKIHKLERDEFLGVSVEDEGVCLQEEEVEQADAVIEETVDKANIQPEPADMPESVKKLKNEVSAMENERDELLQALTCKICLTNRVDTLFLTCRHFCACRSCADRLRDCPVCRQVILGTVDVFMA